jgi:hypothetical protein
MHSLVVLYLDSKQNLDLNLAIAPPSNSDVQMMNMQHNGSGLQVQRSWDDMPVDKSVMVRFKNVVMFFAKFNSSLESVIVHAPLLFHLI